MSFFFSTVVPSPTGDWQAIQGRLDFLLPLYLKSFSESALALATSWLSVVMVGTCLKGKPYFSEGDLLSNALESLLFAVADPMKSLKDETLTTICCNWAGTYEVEDTKQHYLRQFTKMVPRL
jgi:hypothetical protein